MKYYSAIGHVRATIIPRYFMSDDDDVRRGALPDVLEAMGTLVCRISLHYITHSDMHQLVEPLVFEPGSDWGYGQGVDWSGQLVTSRSYSCLPTI